MPTIGIGLSSASSLHIEAMTALKFSEPKVTNDKDSLVTGIRSNKQLNDEMRGK